MYNVFIDS